MDRLLLPAKSRDSIPPIGSDLLTPLRETWVYLRYHDKGSSWRWYVLEFDGKDGLFGLIVTEHMATAGQFTLTELSAISGSDGRGVVLDPHFQPVRVQELARREPNLAELLLEPVPREQDSVSLVSLE